MLAQQRRLFPRRLQSAQGPGRIFAKKGVFKNLDEEPEGEPGAWCFQWLGGPAMRCSAAVDAAAEGACPLHSLLKCGIMRPLPPRLRCESPSPEGRCRRCTGTVAGSLLAPLLRLRRSCASKSGTLAGCRPAAVAFLWHYYASGQLVLSTAVRQHGA